MLKRRVAGKKNDWGIDLPMQIKTNGWEIPSNKDILEIVEAIFENENRIYPRPKNRGASMFLDEIIKRYVNLLKKDEEKKGGVKLDRWM